ncbi:hypothetical protein ADK52_18585 [Streptomyces sp. WM6372]|uniref:hypothetical protein n=1 Tax=Streptomyces sp. WM6372 TaxID=1415555 RepID=UPI0006AE95D0|nr:hypothetical protein [Streptomyces sp. WM6372]KOU23448.1 hypothetical protein ADK52_18585 [Streptomyces sp. WM6372]
MSPPTTPSRLLPSLGGLVTAGLGVSAEAPWWSVATIGFAALLVLRAEALVNARNEARRGLHEGRLLASVPSRQALGYLREVRRAQLGPPPQPEPPIPGTGGASSDSAGA